VFVLLADTLVVFRGGVRTELPCTPDVFHILKAITHVPVAIYAEVQRGGPNEVSGERRDRLENLQKRLLQTRARLQEDSVRLALTEAALRDVHTTLHACTTMLDLALGALTPEALDQFAKALGPVLLRLTHEATRLQLESLDQCVERALAPMSGAERSELHVVVTGDHQARARSLGMQYFRLRLGEPEERVAYAEGVTDEKEAFELVGTRRLDSELARAFFGDEKRLQRDILGDSAETLLRDRPLKPIGR
jgi:hypothetical protein